ncbi:NADH-quinone oxidoreductase subunit N [Hydrogenivirga caldilitoris]|uniref:NADH-quinone oxidoreductase subunit N n=1 Tax=Hydrogenivirga caldilitoris TaxID=246264 RepID=A0A497XTA0_9AQUI|nr:NADH-quinone oxidoreductase subunit N [Hydrogenivirga caldilitoris]RLJ71491.1 NADH-quinone oxidoreductase subunit N [Hydrogenivirga caldilitoris]
MDIGQLVGDIRIPRLELFLPELIVLITAFMLFTLDLVLSTRLKRVVLPSLSAIGYVLALMSVGITIQFQGNTFYGTFTNDYLGILVKVFVLIITLTVLAFSYKYYEAKNSFYGEFYYMLAFTLLGAMILASSYNLIIIYVSLELVSIGFYILTALLRGSFISKEGAFKYLILGGLSIALASYGAVFMYIYSGSIDLRGILSYSGQDYHYLILGLVLFLIGFAIKIGAVPFHFWLPDAYQGAPTPVTALMASVGKLVFFIPVVRIMPLIQDKFSVAWMLTVGVIAAATMLYGNLVALVQRDIKRLLAYSSIAHSGYILAAVAVTKEIGLKAVIYFLLVYTVMAAGSFFVVAMLERAEGWNNEIREFSGLRFSLPYLAFSFLVYMFALLGVPPTVGFVGKALVFMALSFDGLWWLAFIMILSTAISTGYYVRLIVLMYMKDREKNVTIMGKSYAELVSLVFLTLLTVALAVVPGVIWQLLSPAASMLFVR